MKIYELIDSPEKWTKDACARDAMGEIIDPQHKSAVSWCLLGAIMKCYNVDNVFKSPVYKSIKENVGSVSSYNDEHSYEEVVSLVKKLDI